MYIEEIILEGFKSYATRTSISAWDPEFNAITGLNGTGKSNLLDAICFVLGIDNLRQVRATSMQDLVYKKGQAGITKAAVTVVFNNSDPTKSPIGFADCSQVTVTRQIVLNGKNKYLINGHNAQQKAVENLFQSVQLNVNNPHFLIMQGQITRVLNMKPMETLSLIEESAGTRMFEDRKSKAIGTLDKKERKVEEITTLLADTIEPKLNALKSERSEFLEYKRTESDLERLQRLLRAYEYARDSKAMEQEQETHAHLKESINSLTLQNKSDKLELEAVNDEIFNVTKRKEKESKANGKLRELEESCKELSSSMIKIQTQIDFKNEALASEEANIAKYQHELSIETVKLKKLENSLAKVEAQHHASDEKHTKLKGDLKRDEDLLRSLETGISSGSGGSSETGYAMLLKESRDKLSNAQTTMHQAQQRVKSLKSELELMERSAKEAQKESKASSEQMNTFKTAIQSLKDSLKEMPAQPRSLYDERDALSSSLVRLADEIDALKSAAASADFRYHQPDKNFDPSSVKGTVAQLIQLVAANLKYATALEVAAGGRLYNVVVKDEKTASTLLDCGKLARRVTFIPLNKIQSRSISADKVQLAKEVTGGKAALGLALVNFDAEVAKAMEYVLGSTFICETKEAAVTIAFDKRFGYRAVTIDGDVYEPFGTLSGGSTSSVAGTLAKLHQSVVLSKKVKILQEKFDKVSEAISKAEDARRKYMSAEKELYQKEQELEAFKRRFALSQSGQILEKYNKVLEQSMTVDGELQQQVSLIKTIKAECEHYEREHAELNSDRDGKLASIKKQLQVTRDALAKDEAKFKKISEEYQTLRNDRDASINLIGEITGKISLLQGDVKSINEEIAQLCSEHLQTMTRHNGLRVKLDSEMKHLRQFDAELIALETKKKGLVETIDGFSLQKSQLDDCLAACEKQLKRLEERIYSLLSFNPWIKDFSAGEFGKAGGQFDFAQHNMSEVASRVKSLEAHRESLRRTINFNVIDMLDRVEAKDNSLRQMLGTVKGDRGKIEGTIAKLNDYMLDTLNRTWKKVSTDFGQIFAELLPGSTAKLDLLDGEPITSGLDIKVCLGGVWKHSLAELSGGQRSLVALSLILALLQYRPAPMYILDEVDAALDLSHTENIGRLLKSRFKGSQFIVVSLKEGMFANANVLFRTRFRDGVSSVERIDNTKSDAATAMSTKKAALKLRGKASAAPTATDGNPATAKTEVKI